MKIKQYAAFALMGLALGACNKPGGEDPDVVEPEGELVEARVAISIPKSIRTYAPGGADAYATPEEIAANRIDVFIYENGGSYATDHFEFTTNVGTVLPPTAGTNQFGINDQGTTALGEEDDDTFVTSTFKVREGDKLVYVGINLPELIVDRLRTGYYVNEVFEDEDLLTELVSGAAAAGGASNLAFFSFDRTEVDVTATGTAGITFPVSVSRLVAKVVVATSGGSPSTAFNDVSGGTLTNFMFAVGQQNNQMFVAPLIGGQDPNYADGTISSVGITSVTNPTITKLLPVDDGDYKAINDNDSPIDFTDGDNYNLHYTTENTTESPWHQNVTYISVRAEFIPHFLNPDTISGTAATYNSTLVPGGFYAVFTGDNTDGVDALGARYFDDLQLAREFVMSDYFEGLLGGTPITFNNGGTPADLDPDVTPYQEDATTIGDYAADHYIFWYPNSYCYYRIYLNPEGTGSMPAYDVLRNTVYIANITGVNYIGTNNSSAIPGGYEDGTLSETAVTAEAPGTYRGTPMYPGDWFLPAGTPIFPDEDITVTPFAEGLNVEITMEDWVPNEDDYDLN